MGFNGGGAGGALLAAADSEGLVAPGVYGGGEAAAELKEFGDGGGFFTNEELVGVVEDETLRLKLLPGDKLEPCVPPETERFA